jgi:TP901 family phage tail tape measure protein
MAQSILSVKINAIDGFSQKLGVIRQSMGKLTDSMSIAKQKADKMFNFATSTGFATQALSTLKNSTIGLFGTVFKEGADFEESMSKVQAIAKATPKDLQVMSDAAREMGATTSFTAKEAAEGMKYMAMTGMNLETGLIGSTKAALLLAKAGGTELPRTADILSDLTAQFANTKEFAGLTGAEKSQEVADLLGLTMTKTNTTLETLYESFKYIGPVASEVGMSMQQAAAATGLLGDQALKGSISGTALSGMLTRMAAPTAKAESVLAKLGVKTRDENKNLRGFTDVMGDLSAATQNMGTGEKLSTMTAIFGKEAGRLSASMKILGMGKKKIDDLTESFNKAGGTTKVMSDIMGDNVNGRLKEMDSMLSELKLTIFDTFKQSLKGVIPYITATYKWLAQLVKNNPMLSKTIFMIVTAIGAVAAVLLPIVAIVAGVSASWGTLLLIGAALKIMFASLLMPIIAVAWPILAVVAVVGLLYAYWEDIVEIMEEVYEWFDDLSPAVKLLTYTVIGLMAVLLPFVSIPILMAVYWEEIVELFDELTEAWANTDISVKNLLLSLIPLGSVANTIIENWDEMPGAFDFILDTIIENFKTKFALLTGIWNMLPDGVKSFFTGSDTAASVNLGQPTAPTVGSLDSGAGVNSNMTQTTTNKSELVIKLPKGISAELSSDNASTSSGDTGAAMRIIK